MPSSGYGLVSLLPFPTEGDLEAQRAYTDAMQHLGYCAQVALENGLFAEWMSSFLAAWETTKDVIVAANAGIIEWDL